MIGADELYVIPGAGTRPQIADRGEWLGEPGRGRFRRRSDQARSSTTRRPLPERSRSKASPIPSSGSRCEISRSSGSRPRRVLVEDHGKSRSGRAEP